MKVINGAGLLSGHDACYESGFSFYCLRCCALWAFFDTMLGLICFVKWMYPFAIKFITAQVGREILNYPTNNPSWI